MNTFMGADTEKLRAHADLLRDRARTIEDLRGRLEPIVMDEGMWKGPDADAFRARWSSEASAKFADSASVLERWGGDLDAQAEEQDTTSEPSSEGSGPGGEGGSGPSKASVIAEMLKQMVADWWNQQRQQGALYAKLQGLFNKGKKVWDIAKQYGNFFTGMNLAENLHDVVKAEEAFRKGIADTIFKPGKEFAEFAKGLAGKLGIPQGFGPKNFFEGLDEALQNSKRLATVAPFLAKAAPWVGRAIPGLDIGFGLHQAITSYQKGDMFHTATSGTTALGGTMMLAGAAMSATGIGAVAGAPIAAAGAVIVAGAAVADVGKMVVDDWPQIQETAGKVWDGAKDFASTALDGTKDIVSTGYNTAKDALTDGVSTAKSAVTDGFEAAGEGARNLANGAKGALDRIFG